MTSAERQDVDDIYILTTLGKLEKDYSKIAWTKWFTAVFPSTIIFTEHEPVVLGAPSYIERLQKLLAATPKRTVANYMYWRAVADSIDYLNEKSRNQLFLWESKKLGHSEKIPRWKECVISVTKSLPLSAGALYVKNYFNEKAKTAAVKMTENIKTAFRKNLKKVNY